MKTRKMENFAYEKDKDKTKEQLIDEVNELRRQNAQLEASEKKYRSLIENVNDIILIMNLKGTVMDANKKAEEFSGYSRKELPINVLKLITPANALKFATRLKKLKKEKKLPPTEYTMKKRNGEEVTAEITSTLIETKGKSKGIMVVARDSTERKKAEERIRNSLKEKEVLLKEIHHRVKNNMQIISSLLSLQEMHLKDPSIRKTFRESQNRIRSMALIHEKLYHSEDLARIDIKEYIDSLSADLFRTYNIDPVEIALQNNVKDIYLTLDTAIPCCLIINDLVSNSLRHAFTPAKDNMAEGRQKKQKGRIQVNLSSNRSNKNENEYTYNLVVRDNGIGFPEDFDYKNTETLGFQLVSMFVKKLRGKMELSSRSGAETRIIFSIGEGEK